MGEEWKEGKRGDQLGGAASRSSEDGRHALALGRGGQGPEWVLYGRSSKCCRQGTERSTAAKRRREEAARTPHCSAAHRAHRPGLRISRLASARHHPAEEAKTRLRVTVRRTSGAVQRGPSEALPLLSLRANSSLGPPPPSTRPRAHSVPHTPLERPVVPLPVDLAPIPALALALEARDLARVEQRAQDRLHLVRRQDLLVHRAVDDALL